MHNEEGIFQCSWRQIPNGFELWVQRHPTLRVDGSVFSEAEERLKEVIYASGLATHAVFEFTPLRPLTELERSFTFPRLLNIYGDTGFELIGDQRQNPNELFMGGYCKRCNTALGSRNDTPAILQYAGDGEHGGMAFARSHLYFYSEEFLGLLTAEERGALKFRQAIRASKRGRAFHELVGPAGLREVAIAGCPLEGWTCSKCGTSCFGSRLEGTSFTSFVAREDLPEPLPSVFTIFTPGIGIQLCMTAARWAQLVGKRESKGLISSDVGVVDSLLVVRAPKLPPC